jgi:HNH endonuclease
MSRYPRQPVGTERWDPYTGYSMVKVGRDHPAFEGPWVTKHALVWWEHTGEKVHWPDIIHHRDGVSWHNDFDNLERIDNEEHMARHAKLRQIKSGVV